MIFLAWLNSTIIRPCVWIFLRLITCFSLRFFRHFWRLRRAEFDQVMVDAVRSSAIELTVIDIKIWLSYVLILFFTYLITPRYTRYTRSPIDSPCQYVLLFLSSSNVSVVFQSKRFSPWSIPSPSLSNLDNKLEKNRRKDVNDNICLMCGTNFDTEMTNYKPVVQLTASNAMVEDQLIYIVHS